MEFQLEGIRYRVTEIDPPKVFAVATGTIEEVVFNYFDLVNQSTFYSVDTLIDKAFQQREGKKYVSILDTLEDEQQKVVQDRFDLIEPILLLEKAKNGDVRASTRLKSIYGHYFKQKTIAEMSQERLIELVSEVYNTSKRTIKRRLTEYRKEESSLPNQGKEGLIPKVFKQNFNRKDCKVLEICHPKKPDLVLDTIRVRLPDEVLPVIKEVIEKEYLTLRKDTPTSVFESIEAKCGKQEIEPPIYDTVYKILKRLSPEIRSRMREGKKGDETYNEVDRGYSNKEAMFPLHIVEIDHTELDIDVLDEKSGYVIGRPWITLGIDVFSRMVWCMDVSFEPPSANKVRQALGLNLSNAQLSFTKYRNSILKSMDLTVSILNNSEFIECNLDMINMTKCRLHAAYFEDCTMINANLNKVELLKSRINSVDLRFSNLSYANFRDSYFHLVNFEGANFDHVGLGNVVFDNCNMNSVTLFKNRRLLKGNFVNSSLQKVDFYKCNLSNTSFRNADLTSANLCGSILTGVNFHGTILNETKIYKYDYDLYIDQLKKGLNYKKMQFIEPY